MTSSPHFRKFRTDSKIFFYFYFFKTFYPGSQYHFTCSIWSRSATEAEVPEGTHWVGRKLWNPKAWMLSRRFWHEFNEILAYKRGSGPNSIRFTVLQSLFSIIAENIFELNFVAYKFACNQNCGVPWVVSTCWSVLIRASTTVFYW